jgi:proliferating cell nuclear antigen PCNA
MAIVELHLKDAIPFRNAIRALVDHLPQVNLHFTKDGLSISGRDMSHTSVISYFLSSKDCTSYKCDAVHIVKITLSLLDRILRMISGGEEFTLTVQDGSDTISILLVHSGLSLKRSFELPTLDIHIEGVDIKEIELDADITMSTSDFVGRIKEFHKFNSDNIILQVSDDGLQIEVDGDMKGFCLFEPTDDRFIAKDGDVIRQDYSLKLLHGILVAAADLSPTIHISFEKENLIRFKFLFGNSIFISYIAPKIVDD